MTLTPEDRSRIDAIFDALGVGMDGVPENTPFKEADFVQPGMGNNETTVRIDGHEYRITIEPVALELTTEVNGHEPPNTGHQRKFKNDHRDNPGLHQLYVSWAIEDLELLADITDRLDEVNRWPLAAIAGDIHQAVEKHILEDAAWFEAAAIVFAKYGTDAPKPPKILTGESLSNMPPGTYEMVLLTDKDGNLVAELADGTKAEAKS